MSPTWHELLPDDRRLRDASLLRFDRPPSLQAPFRPVNEPADTTSTRIRSHSPRSVHAAPDPVCPPVRPSIPFASLRQILVSENENRRCCLFSYIRSEPPTSRRIWICRDIVAIVSPNRPARPLCRYRDVCQGGAEKSPRPRPTEPEQAFGIVSRRMKKAPRQPQKAFLQATNPLTEAPPYRGACEPRCPGPRSPP